MKTKLFVLAAVLSAFVAGGVFAADEPAPMGGGDKPAAAAPAKPAKKGKKAAKKAVKKSVKSMKKSKKAAKKGAASPEAAPETPAAPK